MLTRASVTQEKSGGDEEQNEHHPAARHDVAHIPTAPAAPPWEGLTLDCRVAEQPKARKEVRFAEEVAVPEPEREGNQHAPGFAYAAPFAPSLLVALLLSVAISGIAPEMIVLWSLQRSVC